MQLDSHQHFWRYSPVEHSWMSDAMTAIKRDFLPSDLRPKLVGAGFDGCVAVQARQSLEETLWLLELAKENDFIRAVVGWVDLRSKALQDQLQNFSQSGKLAGVRHVVQDEPDDEFMLRPDFRRGIAQLQDFCLTYDLLIHPRHLPIATKLVREFPNQHFVLDHLAKPNIAEQQLLPWRDDLSALAESPNVFCKLSGMVTEAKWKGWAPEDFDPFLDAAFAAFGPDRLMIGSDWPVCTVSGNYQATMGIVIDYIQKFSADERAGVLGENCARFYRISRSE